MRFESRDGSLLDALRKLNIQRGDILYVASDITTLVFNMVNAYGVSGKSEIDAGLDELVDTFQEAVGEEGTLLFPVFAWEWCSRGTHNVKTTKCEEGALANWILKKRSDFVRTRHPIYSFLVWGKDAAYLRSMDNQDAWSHSSPFYYMQMRGAKNLLFNIEPYQGMTFGHYVEQEVQVPYRHIKYFFGDYTDEEGITEKRMYSMSVRDRGVVSGCSIRNDWLIEKSVAERVEWEGNELTLVDLQKSYDVIKDDMVNNNGENTLYFETGELDWSKKQTVLYEVKGIDV